MKLQLNYDRTKRSFNYGVWCPNFTGINNMISKGDIITFNLVDKGLEPITYYYGNYLVDYSVILPN